MTKKYTPMFGPGSIWEPTGNPEIDKAFGPVKFFYKDGRSYDGKWTTEDIVMKREGRIPAKFIGPIYGSEGS